MPLRVELKPFERIVIGDCVLINSDTRASFLIDGEAPVLREKDTVTAESAVTPARRLYLCVQTMYLKGDVSRYRESYRACLGDLKRALPDASALIDAVDVHVAGGALYKALKDIRQLIRREQDRVAA